MPPTVTPIERPPSETAPGQKTPPRGCRKAAHGTLAGSQGARRVPRESATEASRAGWAGPRVADEAPAYPSHPGLTAAADGAWAHSRTSDDKERRNDQRNAQPLRDATKKGAPERP